ncbi:MAG: hypothetical protein IJU57_06205 [Clostridia bacterium]|nr:hypothetical protein [Clostridia bacterium]
MDFIEEVKRSATNFAEMAKEKTATVTNLAKLNINLKTTEAKLGEVYEEIGRLFYKAERENLDNNAAITEYILEADRYSAEIEQIKKDLAKLRNVKVCPKCGNEIDISFEYCNHCGEKQEMPEEPEEECCCGCEEAEEAEEKEEDKE